MTSTLAEANGVYTLSLRDQQQIFDGSTGRLTGIRDAHGRQVSLTYTGTPARLTSITDMADGARSLTIGYDDAGRIESISDGTGRTVGYGYDTDGNLASVTDVMNRTTTYFYEDPTNPHLLTRIQNALQQNIEQIAYDTTVTPPRVQSQILHDGRQLQFAYSSDTTILTTTGQDGQQNVSEYHYSADNTLTGIVSNGQAISASNFDTDFNPSALADGAGHITTARFNSAGLPTTQTNSLGQTSQAQYDDQYRLTRVIDALGVATAYTYDSTVTLRASPQVSPLQARSGPSQASPTATTCVSWAIAC